MRNKLLTIALAFILTVSPSWSAASAHAAQGEGVLETESETEPDESLMGVSPYMTAAENEDEIFVADVEINPAYDDVVLPEELAVLTPEEQDIMESVAAGESIDIAEELLLSAGALGKGNERTDSFLIEASDTCTSYAETASVIVSRFQSREEEIALSINITTGEELSEEYAAIDQRTDIDADAKWEEKYAVFYRYIWRNALNHDKTKPTQGDYMAYQYGGYTASYRGTKSTGTGAVNFSGTLTYRMYKEDDKENKTSLYYTTAEQEAELTAALDPIMASLCPEGLTDEEKLAAIYDYICKNVRYDYDHGSNYYLKYTAYAALINKLTVCQGYSSLFYRMALTAGVDSRIISGYGKTGASSGGNHAWNIMKLGDAYYLGDTTWDEGKSSYTYRFRGDVNFVNHYPNHLNVRTTINNYSTGARPNWFVEDDFPIDSEDWDRSISLREYAVSFDGNGADGGTPVESVTLARQVLTAPGLVSKLCPCTFSRSEHRFDGWSFTEDGESGTFKDSGTTDAVTLYAVWVKLPKASAPRVFYADGEEILSRSELDIDEAVYIRSETDDGLPVFYTVAYRTAEAAEPDGISGQTVDKALGLYWDRSALRAGELSVAVTLKLRTGATEYYSRSDVAEYTFALKSWDTVALEGWGEVTEADRAGFESLEDFTARTAIDPVWIAPLPTAQEMPGMYSYTGQALTWGDALHIYDTNRRLKEGTDYSLSYSNNMNAGTARIDVKYKGNYTGSSRVTWVIDRADISSREDCVVEGAVTGADGEEYLYSAETGAAQKPVPVIRWNNRSLKVDTEYRVVLSGDFIGAGTAAIKLVGVGNFKGERSLNFVIEPASTADDSVTVINISMSKVKLSGFKSKIGFDKSGARQTALALTGPDGTALVEGIDYTVSYILPRDPSGGLSVGKATVIFIGTGSAKSESYASGGRLLRFYGSVKKTCTVKGISMSGVKLRDFVKEMTYNGEVRTQDFSEAGVGVYSGAEKLAQDTDFTVSYSPKEPVSAGKVTVTLKGKGGYTGKLKRTYKIKKVNLASCGEELSVNIIRETDNEQSVRPEVYYIKGGSKPVPEVILSLPGAPSAELVNGKDFKLKYTGNKAVRSGAALKLTGKGNYTGSTDWIYFDIAAKPLESGDIKATVPVVIYKEKAGYALVKPVLKDGNGKRLINGRDYIISGYTMAQKQEDGSTGSVELTRKDIPSSGEHLMLCVEAKSGGNYSGSRDISYTVVKADISKAKAVLTPARFSYTGRRIKPTDNADAALSVRLKDGTRLKAGEDFQIRYGENTAVGNGYMTIVGVGDYGGTKTVKFKITKRQVR